MGGIMMRIDRTKGFTLVELIVVIAIVAILVGFTSVGKDIIRRGQVMSTARELLVDIHRARMSAITQEGKGFGIRFESPISYVLFKFNDCDNDNSYDADTCEGKSREETIVMRRTIKSDVVLSKTNTANIIDNEILIFDRFGRPRQANWGMGMMTILVRHDHQPGFVQCVTISLNRVREAYWNGSACI
jgi:prepilin-type N-terminal cleavage/methylation domain-containing protein